MNFNFQDAEEFDDEDIAMELMPELDNANAVSVTIAGQLQDYSSTFVALNEYFDQSKVLLF